MPRYTAVLVVFCSLLSNSLLRARCASQGAHRGTYSLGGGLEPGLKLSILPTPSHDAHVYAVPSGGVLRRASGRSVGSPREVDDIRVALGLALQPHAGRRQEGSADVYRGSYVDQSYLIQLKNKVAERLCYRDVTPTEHAALVVVKRRAAETAGVALQ